MALVLDGTNKITATELADDAVTTAKIADSAITDALLPAGSVLQVVQGEHSAEQDTTSATFVSTGLTATITPSSTSSKIYIQVALACSGAYEASGGGATAIYRIFDVTNSSALIQTADRVNDYGNSGMFSFSNHAINYLVSPSTTSAVTYRVDHKLADGDASRVFNDSGGGSKGTITLMEIAG